jgi:hypothetical protein
VRVSLVIATTLCLSWSSARAQEYSFPYHDPYLATMTTVILNADGVTAGLKRQVVHVPVLPGRKVLPSLEGRDELSVALYRQVRPAPLIFILSGIGSSPYFGLATYFARLFHQVGFHVVILPSPTNWNFALAASRSGAPGYAPEDARDLYAAMQRALDAIRARYGVKTTSINFMGASLGALEGAYLSVLDGSERRIGIEKYLLVNPPLDLSYALKRLDQWDALQDKFGRQKSEAILARALAIVEPYATEDRDDPATLDRLEKEFSSFTTEEIQFLIAENAQSALPELVYVTQVLHDQRVLKAGRDQARKRLEEAKGWTLLDYRQKIAVPLWRLQIAEPAADLESFDRRGSLAPVLGSLRGNSRVYIMHNADDVLVERKPLEELKRLMGDRMTLYPYGGHLGNLWYSENKRAILKLFSASP